MRLIRDEEHGAGPRRQLIRRLLGERRVSTQGALRSLLARAGHRVTQGTLSRDLAALGARRAPLPGGGSAYELPGGEPTQPSGGGLGAVGSLVLRARANGSLVVVHTRPGAASAVALALDQAQLPEALGTIAGDDTVFVAPAPGITAARLRHRLERLFERASRA